MSSRRPAARPRARCPDRPLPPAALRARDEHPAPLPRTPPTRTPVLLDYETARHPLSHSRLRVSHHRRDGVDRCITRHSPANDHTDPPAVLITGPADGEPLGAVTAVVTNDFRTGELLIRKDRIGAGVADFGVGPFQAQAICTWQANGQTLTVPLADGGIVSLGQDDDYQARLGNIPVGAQCAITETDAGLATEVTLTPTDGTVTILDPTTTDDTATVTITNRFDVGQLAIDKTADTAVALVGDTVRYTLTVRNTGEIDASDVTVTDRLPAGTEVVGIAPTGRVHDGVIDGDIESLSVGDTMQFTVDLRLGATGTVVNRATVSTPEGPWRAAEVGNGRDDASGMSCAVVVVTPPLAQTGGGVWIAVIVIALLLLAAGALMLIHRRRERTTEAPSAS